MADKTISYPLQSLGAGDVRAGALVEYNGMVLAQFLANTSFYLNVVRKPAPKGAASVQFPKIGEASTIEHAAGTELTGQGKPTSKFNTVPLDTRQIVSDGFLDEVSDFISHFDVRSTWANRYGHALSKKVDGRIAKMIFKGAAEAATGDFLGGNSVTRSGSLVLATAYPVSLTGSKNLQDDLANLGQLFDDDDLPKEGRLAWVTPYLERVLRQDKTLMSVEYKSPNNMFTRQVLMVEGFMILNTTLMPTTNITEAVETQYSGDYTTNVLLALADPSGIGCLEAWGPQGFGPEYSTDHLAFHIGAKWFGGVKWTNPEACGRVILAA